MNKILIRLSKLNNNIEFKRKKKLWLMQSILYRVNKLMNLLFGSKFVLKFLLNLNQVIWRLAYENSYNYYGKQFPNITYGISEKLLKDFIPPNANVVDIGCGTGRLTFMASKFSKTCLGVDYKFAAIEFANKNNNSSNITYICEDIKNFNNNFKYDLAILAGVLEHLDSDEKYLLNLHNIASRLIIEVPDINADPLNTVRFNLSTRIYSDDDHVREYSYDSLLKQLKIANWKVIYSSRQGLMITLVVDEKNIELLDR
jgi:2-polyprenyl-3-methyl-5-hydroxy-6-metoxy-1,4-benzoquinol methylase